MSSSSTKDYFVYTSKQGNKYLIPVKYQSLTSVSDIIRAMSSDGFSQGALAKSTGIRPQHVSNVLGSSKKNQSVLDMIAKIESQS